MADTIAVVGELGTIYRRPDGSLYFADPFGLGTIECGARDLATCAAQTVGAVLPTLNTEAPLAIINDLETRLSDALNLEARSQLSFLSTPLTQALANTSAYTGGLVPLLEAVPQLADAVNQASTYIDQQIEAMTVRDPRDGLSPLELYLDGRDRSAAIEASPAISAEKERLMGLLDDLGLSGFTSSNTFNNLLGSAGGFSFLPTSQDAGSPPIATTSGGVLGTIDQIGGSLINILGGLSRAGIIRGSVGEFFTGGSQQSPSAGVSASNVGAMNLASGGQMPTILDSLLAQLNFSGNSVGDGSMMGSALSGLENLLGVNQGCGNRSVRLNAMQAMPLFKQGCARAYIPRRIYVDGPDGTPYVLYNAGQASIGSREQSVARSIARRSGFKLLRRGSGSGTRRRRPR